MGHGVLIAHQDGQGLVEMMRIIVSSQPGILPASVCWDRESAHSRIYGKEGTIYYTVTCDVK